MAATGVPEFNNNNESLSDLMYFLHSSAPTLGQTFPCVPLHKDTVKDKPRGAHSSYQATFPSVRVRHAAITDKR